MIFDNWEGLSQATSRSLYLSLISAEKTFFRLSLVKNDALYVYGALDTTIFATSSILRWLLSLNPTKRHIRCIVILGIVTGRTFSEYSLRLSFCSILCLMSDNKSLIPSICFAASKFNSIIFFNHSSIVSPKYPLITSVHCLSLSLLTV